MNTEKYIASDTINNFAKHVARLAGTTVFTNGCFDILHPGHLAFLAKARKKGDILIVGLNSDESVRRLKGDQRPINSFEDRVLMLAGLESVDYITGFEDDTPAELIQIIKPDVLVKGGDYTVDNIVGAAFVKSYGGKVEALSFEEGYSTSNIIQKIKSLRDL